MGFRTFFCYSHEDEKWLSMLKTYLKPYQAEGMIDLWDDTAIRPGDKWLDEIQMALQQAEAAVFLVTGNFLASDFILRREVPILLQRAKDDGVRILWIAVEPHAPDHLLTQYQAVNDSKRPLSSFQGNTRRQQLVDIAYTIATAIESTDPTDNWYFIGYGYDIADETTVALALNTARPDTTLTIRSVPQSQFGPDLIIAQPSKLNMAQLDAQLRPKIDNSDPVIVVVHRRHLNIIKQWVRNNTAMTLEQPDGAVNDILTGWGIDRAKLIKEILECASNSDIAAEQVRIEAVYERRPAMLDGPNPYADLLEQVFWQPPDSRRLFFYTAVYMAGYPNKPDGITQYLTKRIPGVDVAIAMLPLFFERPPRPVLKKDGIHERVQRLIERDFGHPPEHFVKLSEQAFHDSQATNGEFMRTMMGVIHDRLGENGLQFVERTQDIIGESEGYRLFLVSNPAQTTTPAWCIVALFSPTPAHFATISTAFSSGILFKNMGSIAKDAVTRCVVIAPTFDNRAMNAALSLESGIALLDATAIWQLDYRLLEEATARTVAAHFYEFLQDQSGLINIDEGLKRLGVVKVE